MHENVTCGTCAISRKCAATRRKICATWCRAQRFLFRLNLSASSALRGSFPIFVSSALERGGFTCAVAEIENAVSELRP
jgi:hypothetical protein